MVKKRSLLFIRKNILLKNHLFFSSQYLFKSIPWQRLIFFVCLSTARKVDSDFPKLLDSSSNLLNQDLQESGLVIWIFNKCPSWLLSSKCGGGNGPGVATENMVNTRRYQLHLGARQAGSVSGPSWSQSHQNQPFNKVPSVICVHVYVEKLWREVWWRDCLLLMFCSSKNSWCIFTVYHCVCPMRLFLIALRLW